MSIISYNKSFVFVHIQKCGGTSIEKEWAKSARWGDFVIGSSFEGGDDLERAFRRLYGIEKHTRAETLRNVIGQSAYGRMRSLALVREPLRIIESDYRFAQKLMDVLVNRFAKASGRRSEIHEKVKKAARVYHHPQLPEWWYHHHDGSIAVAIGSDSFAEYLERVCDARWDQLLANFVTDGKSNVIVSDIIKLEQPDLILRYFKESLMLKDFELRWENKGKALDLIWPSDLRAELRKLCSYDYEMFGY